MGRLDINPIVLIIVNIIAPSMYIFISGKYLLAFLLIYAAAVLLLMGCYKRTLFMFALYAAMTGIYHLTMLSCSTQFIGLFFLVLSQSIPCVILASTLISKYNSAQLLSALETLHIPRIMVVAVTITLKYIPTFTREFKLLRESMRLRGIDFTMRKPIRSFQYFVVPQLFRCASLADEVTAAGMVKGIDVPIKRTSYFEQKVRWSDYLILAIFILGLGGCIICQKML